MNMQHQQNKSQLYSMDQPKRYLAIVGDMFNFYQQELFNFFRKTTADQLRAFKDQFDTYFKIIKEIEINKSIEKDKMSQICSKMDIFLNRNTRVKKTSQSERYAIRSSLRTQEGHRMRFTGGIKKIHGMSKQQQLSEVHQLDQIIKSYKIQHGIEPRMRMKWKSIDQHNSDKKNQSQQRSTIGDNNINLLSYTIPEIQNSIKRLSIQSQSQSHRQNKSPDRLQNYRTIDTRNQHRKKYVPRLI